MIDARAEQHTPSVHPPGPGGHAHMSATPSRKPAASTSALTVARPRSISDCARWPNFTAHHKPISSDAVPTATAGGVVVLVVEVDAQPLRVPRLMHPTPGVHQTGVLMPPLPPTGCTTPGRPRADHRPACGCWPAAPTSRSCGDPILESRRVARRLAITAGPEYRPRPTIGRPRTH